MFKEDVASMITLSTKDLVDMVLVAAVVEDMEGAMDIKSLFNFFES